jgi:seryl-tRNA synthetase
MALPNLLHPDVPDGPDESANRVVRVEGERREFDFSPKPHWELGPALGILDFERGVKISGSRFYVLRGQGSRLQRSLIQWMLDTHVDQHGCTEVYPPFIVKEQAMWGAGQLPKFWDNLYRDAEDDVFLVPTAEVPVTNLYRDEILHEAQLPMRYVAYTPCFRREKMSAGRDVRGMKRGHQFDKVELYTFCKPEESQAELERIQGNAEAILQALGLQYRVVELCSGDVGFAMTRTFDLEVWAPGSQEWLEVSSCSNAGDFQARRANIRYRSAETGKPEFVHTLNGSALALPRVMIAVMETYQQADGTVLVPEVLRSRMGSDRISQSST